jgi:hypothetical protein
MRMGGGADGISGGEPADAPLRAATKPAPLSAIDFIQERRSILSSRILQWQKS